MYLDLFNQKPSSLPEPFSVSDFLDVLNEQLKINYARVKGEVSGLTIKKHVYFDIKDKNGSVLNCIVWESNYKLSGVELKEGMEIIVEGYPDIYKPSGRLSFKASSLELVGEGALKKAYDELKVKLEKEGLFGLSRKREIPYLPRKIGLITSETGAVIHDFSTNLGSYGFKVLFYDSRVEGASAVKDLLAGLDYFEKNSVDVVVIMRGGGSLESLQAFNNETLVRRIASFSVPVLCGIGHDKDVPLSALAADLAVSTPTACAVALGESWKQLHNKFELLDLQLLQSYNMLINNLELKLNSFPDIITKAFNKCIDTLETRLISYSQVLVASDPKNILRLGYSVVFLGGKVIKSDESLQISDSIDVLLTKGKIKAEVTKKY